MKINFNAIISNLIIIFIFAIFVSLLGLNISNSEYFSDSLLDIFVRFILPAFFTILTLFAFYLSRDGRLALINSFVAFVVAVYCAEGYLIYQYDRSMVGAGGGVGDSRSKIEVIQDLRAQGVNAYPAMRALSLLVENQDGEVVSDIRNGDTEFLSFGSIPDTTVVSCNESGQWLVYKSGPHGFNNPPEAWDSRASKIGMIGDSFAHGSCVPPDKNIAGHLRRRFGDVINLGVSGNGPLMELASLKEYLEPLAPKTVLWFFYEGNDISENLPFERKSRLLMSYLNNDEFRQGLMNNNGEVSKRLKLYLDEHLLAMIEQMQGPFEDLLDFIQIYHLRRQLGLGVVSLGLFEGAKEDDFRLFSRVLKKAKSLVASWGGELHFVYLPESDRYFSKSGPNRIRNHIRRRVIDIVSELKIDLIDVHEVLARLPDARQHFYYPGSHYNERGYQLTADIVAKALGAETKN